LVISSLTLALWPHMLAAVILADGREEHCLILVAWNATILPCCGCPWLILWCTKRQDSCCTVLHFHHVQSPSSRYYRHQSGHVQHISVYVQFDAPSLLVMCHGARAALHRRAAVGFSPTSLGGFWSVQNARWLHQTATSDSTGVLVRTMPERLARVVDARVWPTRAPRRHLWLPPVMLPSARWAARIRDTK
jgi:hypothetical protein